MPVMVMDQSQDIILAHAQCVVVTGQVRSSQGFFTVQQTCPQCSGSGEEIANPCGSCGGSGKNQTSKDFQ